MAIVDDIRDLIALAIALGRVQSAATDTLSLAVAPIAWILAKAAGFLAGTFVFGQLVVLPIMAIVHTARSRSVPIVISVAYCFMIAALAEQLGLTDIVGAFTAGLVVNDDIGRFFGAQKEEYRRRLDDSIGPLNTIFIPVFFFYMGLRVDLLAFTALLSVTAIVSKQACIPGSAARTSTDAASASAWFRAARWA